MQSMGTSKFAHYTQDEMEPHTPRSLGYRMPAEWEPHAATWLAWPHKRESWPDKFEPIPLLYA
jgi:agmatine/peptidylarginine deiminase